jgi:uroporphyrinogen decarboxylase
LTGLERIQRTIAAIETDRTPSAPLFGAYALTAAGVEAELAYRNATVQAQALLHTAQTQKSDAVFTLMDLSAEPEALGAGTAQQAGARPVVTQYIEPAALAAADLKQKILTARVPVFLETVRLLRRESGNELLVGALLSGPMTAACNTLGIATVARMLRKERELLVELLVEFSAACSILACAYAGAGAHAVMLLEPCATSMILSPDDFTALLAPRLVNIFAACRTARLLTFLHVCGNATVSVPALVATGAQVLSMDAPVDLRLARDCAHNRTVVMGNVDSRQLLPRGTPEAISASVCNLLLTMHTGGKFILSTGCEIPAETPAANVAALMACRGQL